MSDEADPAEAPAPPPEAPTPPPAAPEPPPAPGMFGPPPPGYAFAPVARAPRVPWVNPARRTQVVLTSLVAAAVIFFIGLAGGWAIHHDGSVGRAPFKYGRAFPGPTGPGFPGFGPRFTPRSPGTVPTPVPSKTTG